MSGNGHAWQHGTRRGLFVGPRYNKGGTAMISFIFLFLGVFLWTFSVNLFSKYRQQEIQIAKILIYSTFIVTLVIDFQLFLQLIVSLIPLKLVSLLLVYKFFKSKFPTAVNINLWVFFLREFYRSRLTYKQLSFSTSGMINIMNSNDKNQQEFEDFLQRLKGSTDVMKIFSDKKITDVGIKRIYDELSLNCGGRFVAQRVLQTPQLLWKYLSRKDIDFESDDYEQKKPLFLLTSEIDIEDKRLAESFGFPDAI